ncbi:MAG: hypothetical protein IK016_04045 [Lachnospiraceae bacterium]|nr:hypothetical protein [Lachnospiraceae bacterium]
MRSTSLRKKKKKSKLGLVIPYLLIYGVCSALFLTRFPFIHSDESWLAGLSRDMSAADSYGVTESFFNAKPRYPHAIKIIYHAFQRMFIAFFGYSPFAVRLLSLCAALMFLYLFYLLAKRFGGSEKPAFALTVLLSLSPWMIYISHFARQESWLLVLMAEMLLVLTSGGVSTSAAATAAVITGVAIGFHPNAFLLATVAGAVLCVQFVQARRGASTGSAAAGAGASGTWQLLRPALVYIGITAAFAALFVGISYGFGADFLSNYFAYGAADFGLDAAPAERLTEFIGFFARLWRGESGTYYLPETRLFLLAAALTIPAGVITAVRKKDGGCAQLLAGLLGLLIGIYIIGRFNQMSLVFFFPFVYLLWGRMLSLATVSDGAPVPSTGAETVRASTAAGGFVSAGMTLALVVALGMSVWQIRPWLLPPESAAGQAAETSGQAAESAAGQAAESGSYEEFLEKLAAFVPKDAKTLGNLNTGFYFDQGKLLDYRNLPYVMEAAKNATPSTGAETAAPSTDTETGEAAPDGVSAIAAYVEENGIEYILYTAELDYLLSHRPYYNVIYGNIMFAEALKAFCETRCETVGSFTDLRYGARVIALTGDETYSTVTVYRVAE